MRFRCPVCLFDKLEYPPNNYEICPCCGTEFGNDDERVTHAQLRSEWIARDGAWFFRNPPPLWNPWMQLINAGYGAWVPKLFVDFRFQANVTVENAGLRYAHIPLETQLAR
jgi:hypothetical protein